MTEEEFDRRLKEIEDLAKEYNRDCDPVEIYLRKDPSDGWKADYRYNELDFYDDDDGDELGHKLFLAEKYCGIPKNA